MILILIFVQKSIRLHQNVTSQTRTALNDVSSPTALENGQDLEGEGDTWVSNFVIGDPTFRRIQVELEQLEGLKGNYEKLNLEIEALNSEIEELESLSAMSPRQQAELSRKKREKERLERNREATFQKINFSAFIIRFRVGTFFGDLQQTFKLAFQFAENLNMENVQPYRDVAFGIL